MPVKGVYDSSGAPAPNDAQPSGVKGDYLSLSSEKESPNTQTDWTIPAMIGAGVAGAGALALHNPAAAKAIGTGISELRQMSMLTGLAPLKSLLGNIGGTVNASIERGSLKPLSELFSGKTLEDVIAAYKAGSTYSDAASGPVSKFVNKLGIPTPGRVMGAFDDASQSALQRAGLSSKEAAAEMLQAPIDKSFSKALSNPVARWLIPFRRTPFNQLKEGMNTFNADTVGKKAALAYNMGTGAVSGATAEEPQTVGLTAAASGRYAVPHVIAAGLARAAVSGSKAKGAQLMQGMTPVSDYSLSEGVLGPVMDPTKVIPRPAAIPAYDYIKKLLGLE